MQIKSFDRPTISKVIRPEIENALQEIGKKFGIQIRVGNASYSSENMSIKVELAVTSSDGTVITKERSAYQQLADVYQLKLEWLDKTFVSGDRTYKIVGLAPKKHKRPVICVYNGKQYVFPAETVGLYMNAGTPTLQSLPSNVIGRANPNHDEIERRIADMRNNNPEGYYADGEHHAAGMSEKQIHDMHYRQIAREIASGR